MKYLLVGLFLLTACLLWPTPKPLQYNGHDWQTWTIAERSQFLVGFLEGYYSMLVGLSTFDHDITDHEWNLLAFPAESIETTSLAVSEYYVLTGNLDMPIWGVLIQRNLALAGYTHYQSRKGERG